MSKLSDNYPPGMDECTRNGLNGNCGPDCEVFLRGECAECSHGDYSSYSSDREWVVVIHGGYVFRMIKDFDSLFTIKKDSDVICKTYDEELTMEIFHSAVLKELGMVGEK